VTDDSDWKRYKKPERKANLNNWLYYQQRACIVSRFVKKVNLYFVVLRSEILV